MEPEEIELKDFFLSRLQNPNILMPGDVAKLEIIQEKYPYFAIIPALKAKASSESENFEEILLEASTISNNREIIYHLINQPDSFLRNLKNKDQQNSINEIAILSEDDNSLKNEIAENISEITNSSEIIDVNVLEEHPISLIDDKQDSEETNNIESNFIADLSKDIVEIETYDYREETNDNLKNANQNQIESELVNESEKQILIDGQKDLSNYHDNKLPYTFLWWLDKTRKQFDHNYQPYAQKKSVEKGNIKPLENLLNHQITEHIIQQGTFDEFANAELENEVKTKEDKIIFKFIKEEPHIKPLPSSKIDNENKAQKSSADKQELVSETLAKIYVEQMLYSKALDTYKKLSLKYPEKSAYFASQIKYLELKIN